MSTGTEPRSAHVAVSRMTLFGGQSYEVITVSREFLRAALEDARSWCHEVETPAGPGRTAGSVTDYDAAMAVIGECGADSPAQLLPLDTPVADVCPKCGSSGCLEDRALDFLGDLSRAGRPGTALA